MPRCQCRRVSRPRVVVAIMLIVLLLAACGGAPSGTPARSRQSGSAGASAQPAALPPQRSYVALGASDAFGIGTDDPKTQAWPIALAHLLGKDIHLVDLGIPGATVAQAIRDELPVALDVQPAIVTIWLAVNDFDANVPLPTYERQLSRLITALAAGTHARIFVGNMPDLTLIPYFASRNHQQLLSQVQAWNAGIATVCKSTGASLVSIFAGWRELAEHPEYISGDGFHPSATGAERLAEIFAAAILGTPPARGGHA